MVWVAGGRAIDSIYTTANTCERNNAMLQVPVPFPGLEWPCRYLQITALSKAALAGVICQWPQGRGGGEKVTDTSKPVKNVMVFVKDLASAAAAVEHHSWIRCFGSSGEMVNIKGLCRSLPFRRLLTGDLFMTFSKGGGIHDGSLFLSHKTIPATGLGGGGPHTHSFRFTNLLLSSELCSRLYSSYRPVYLWAGM